MNFEMAEKGCPAEAVPAQMEMGGPSFSLGKDLSGDSIRAMADVCAIDCSSAEGMHCASSNTMQRDVTDVPVEELRPCCAGCCNICSLFCGFPSCIGIAGACTLLCCQCKYVCCKLLDCKDEDSRCAACIQLNWFLTAPNKLYECTGQYCCIDSRAALPCTNKVPCMLTVLSITCCADCKCVGAKPCVRLGDVIPRLDERAGKSGGDA